MTESEPTGATAPTESPTAMRGLFPPDMVERGRCPFDPPAGLARRRAGGSVQPLPLLNGAPAWLVTGFDEAREVLADTRFSADRAQFQENTTTGLNSAASPEERARASAELYAFIRGLVEHKRAHPADDLLSGLIHEADPPLTDDQLVDVALVLLGAGHETTANMLGLGTFALLQDPEQLTTLREDPSLIDGTIEELLRYLSIIQLGVTRVATESITLGGVDIPAGATVVIATPETNRDPEHFPEPDRLDIRRPHAPHLAFGHGVHQCLGQQLARVEMRVGLTELLARLPNLRLAVPAEEVPLRNEMLIFGVHSLPVTWG